MIGVLRLEHRISRDKRITSHVFLSARAFGADFGLLTGGRDHNILKSLEEVSETWGGEFDLKYCKDTLKAIRECKHRGFKIVHLTVYGLPIKEKISELRGFKDLLIIVGGAKVPREIYNLSDYNISVGTQPHSEVAALAIFLHEYHQGKELDFTFQDAKLTVEPREKGKKVLKRT